ncbi:hypothetical protein ABGB14_37520 [Nonomuraea sp. B10E15]|uniref:hypothetical protein n=1 Tax=Nonomuraea sp. B10E15 TaxID=3153560 RepID=UPI00325C3551
MTCRESRAKPPNAEAMTDTPPAVTDHLVSALLGHLTEPQRAELTTIMATENLRARTFPTLS